MNWKKPTNKELIDYYDSEIKRFKKLGGLEAKFNLPYLEERKDYYKSLKKEWYKKEN